MQCPWDRVLEVQLHGEFDFAVRVRTAEKAANAYRSIAAAVGANGANASAVFA
jgi:hypothetical protein